MKILNLAIAFALLAVVGTVIFFFSAAPGTGLFLIIVGEIGAWVCCEVDRRYWDRQPTEIGTIRSRGR